MRIISVKRLESFWSIAKFADSKNPLLQWKDDVENSEWRLPTDVNETFGKRVDFVKSRKTGQSLAVFDIAGNKYLLISAVHYLESYPEKGRVYVLTILTHREYDDDKWRDEF